jgi:mRNA interferase RelE/StbE
VTYSVTATEPAKRDLKELSPQLRDPVLDLFVALAADPRPPGAKALRTGRRHSYRVRIGDLRVGYAVDDRAHVVTVWGVGDRKRFYDLIERRRR